MAGITLPCLECLECRGLSAMLGRPVPPVVNPPPIPIFEDEGRPYPDPDVDYRVLPLSAREIEVLQCVANGLANKQAAHRLGMSDQTVKNHLTSVFRKLQVYDRTQAVVAAIQRGIITV